MELIILQTDKVIYNGIFDSVKLPTFAGEIEVLPNHTAYISPLKKGKIVYKVDNNINVIDIEKGFLEVNKKEVLVMI